jgi:hypothetical protein
MTTQQDHQNEIGAPDGDTEEPTTIPGGHAFWRHAAGPGAAKAESATTEAERADAETKADDDLGEPDHDIVVIESATTEAEPADAETQPADAETKPADDPGEPDHDIVVVESATTEAEPADAEAEIADAEAEPDDDLDEPDDIVVGEVIEEEPGQPSDADPTRTASKPGGVTGPTAAGPTAGAGLSQEWRDIQAAFVDDPRDAVRLAAEATNAALSGVIDSLRRRYDALSAPAADSPEHRDTEQLRGELRQYRVLCQNLAEIEQRLAQPQAA